MSAFYLSSRRFFHFAGRTGESWLQRHPLCNAAIDLLLILALALAALTAFHQHDRWHLCCDLVWIGLLVRDAYKAVEGLIDTI